MNKKNNAKTKEKTLKEELLNDLNVESRIDRRGEKNTIAENNQKERRSGNDRRNDNLIGGRRKTDLTEEDAKEFEKIISSGDGEEALKRLEKNNYKNLNDEAKKIEIKRTIGIHKLNTQRLATLVFLVLLATCIISVIYLFVRKRTRTEAESKRQVNIIQQKLNKKLQAEVDSATLENLDKAFKNKNK